MSYERTSWSLLRRAPLKRKNSDNYYLGSFAWQSSTGFRGFLLLRSFFESRSTILLYHLSLFSHFNLQDFYFFLSFQNDENFFTQLLSITRAVFLSKRLYLTEFQLLLSFAELFLQHKNSFPRENRHLRRV